jgi:site-specific DNA recombinase
MPAGTRRVRLKGCKKQISNDFIFRGLVTCENCGCSITPERKIKKSGKSFVYYSCTNAKRTCKRVYVPESKLLEPVYKVLNSFESITEEAQNTLVKELRESTEAEIAFHKAQVNRIRADYEKIKQKDDRLLKYT